MPKALPNGPSDSANALVAVFDGGPSATNATPHSVVGTFGGSGADASAGNACFRSNSAQNARPSPGKTLVSTPFTPI